MKKTWVGWLNTLLFQWFFFRLAYEEGDNQEKLAFLILFPVVPTTGWGWSCNYVPAHPGQFRPWKSHVVWMYVLPCAFMAVMGWFFGNFRGAFLAWPLSWVVGGRLGEFLAKGAPQGGAPGGAPEQEEEPMSDLTEYDNRESCSSCENELDSEDNVACWRCVSYGFEVTRRVLHAIDPALAKQYIDDEDVGDMEVAKAASAQVRQLRADNAKLMDLAEIAWGIIANAGDGDWSKEGAGWKGAAERWREDYHTQLRAHKAKAKPSP
jgi:hypothetical protein